MYLNVLACDLDGTLAEHGVVSEATWNALRSAKAGGFTLILVTGRTLATFPAEGPFGDLFEAIVAENGSAVFFTRNDSVVLPFGRVDPMIVRRLRSTGIPVEEGMAIIATWMPHISVVDEVLHSAGRGATVEYNKGAVMILPPGATKGTGLTFALNELGFSAHNVIAFGDAENDRSLFEVSEVAVAVANAVSEIQDLADYILPQPNGAGVSSLIAALNSGECVPTIPRRDRTLRLGESVDGDAIEVEPVNLLCNFLGIVGGSGSGKSWLGGLIAEELLTKHYQICIIDPEGDYSGLRAFPHTVVVGGRHGELTPVADVVMLCEYSSVSPILDLSNTPPQDRQAYVGDLIRALQALRQRRGRPHWFLVDEIHNFCPSDGGGLTDLFVDGMKDGGLCVVSYRPSLVAPRLLEHIEQWLLTRMHWEDELTYLAGLVAGSGCSDLELKALRTLPLGDAYFCMGARTETSPLVDTVRFRTARRTVPHVRHLHKYLRAPLPPSKRFYFKSIGPTTTATNSSPPVAASLWEFLESLGGCSIETMRFHLERKDFERWLREVLHDDELARRLRKIRHRDLADGFLREALLETVEGRYEELESLI